MGALLQLGCRLYRTEHACDTGVFHYQMLMYQSFLNLNRPVAHRWKSTYRCSLMELGVYSMHGPRKQASVYLHVPGHIVFNLSYNINGAGGTSVCNHVRVEINYLSLQQISGWGIRGRGISGFLLWSLTWTEPEDMQSLNSNLTQKLFGLTPCR